MDPEGYGSIPEEVHDNPGPKAQVQRGYERMSLKGFLSGLLITLFSALLVGLVGTVSVGGHLMRLKDSFGETSTFNQLVIEISNDGYPPLDPSTELYLKQWDVAHLVEPHKWTNLKIPTGSVTSSSGYTWKILVRSSVKAPSPVIRYEDDQHSEISVYFDSPGTFYDIEVKDIAGGGTSLKLKLICKYVRREIRSLSEADRERFLSALKIFYTVPQAEGRARYGSGYFSQKELTVLHLQEVEEGPTGATCSPWHGGPTFVPSHLAMAMDVERVLQLIDPGVCLPYWNYVRDAEAYGADWAFRSELFSDDYFGAYAAGAAAGEPTGERWAGGGVAVARAEAPQDLATAHNAFGMLTDAYNQDPSPVLRRAAGVCGRQPRALGLPDCAAEARFPLAADLSAFAAFADATIHAKLHVLLGGAWACDLDAEAEARLYGEGSPAARALDTLLAAAPYVWERALEAGLYAPAPEFALPRPPAAAAAAAAGATEEEEGGGGSAAAAAAAMGAEEGEGPPFGFEEARFRCQAFEGQGDLAAAIGRLSDDEVYAFLEDGPGLLALVRQKAGFYQAGLEAVLLEPSEAAEGGTGRYRFAGVGADEDRRLKRALVRLACGPGGLGTMATNSASDPLFVLVHSYFHRHWSALRLARRDWDTTFVEDMDCYGHRASDVMPWEGFLGEETPYRYTQQELVSSVLDPANPALPFIHDSLDFSSCGVSL